MVKKIPPIESPIRVSEMIDDSPYLKQLCERAAALGIKFDLSWQISRLQKEVWDKEES